MGSRVEIMEIVKYSIIFTLLLSMFHEGSTRAQGGLDLGQYKWRKRIIVTYSASEEHPQELQLQSEISQRRCEYNNRNLVHKHIHRDGDFKIALIGYDGYTKFTGSQSSLQELFDIIDVMPMRRREMRNDTPC